MDSPESSHPVNLVTNDPPNSVIKKFSEEILQFTLNCVTILYAAGLAFFLFTTQIHQLFPFFMTLAAIVGLAALVMVTINRRIPYPFRATILLIILLGNALFLIPLHGISGASILMGIACITASSFFFNFRASIITTCLVLITQIIVGRVFINGIRPLTALPPQNSSMIQTWAINLVLETAVGLMIAAVIHQLLKKLVEVENTRETLLSDLTLCSSQLSTAFEEHARVITRKVTSLEISKVMTEIAVTETDTTRLISRTAEILIGKFNVYHVGVFLNDSQNLYTELVAASGPTAQKLLDQHHHLPINQTGIVGHVAATGDPRISQNVKVDAKYYGNPLLPETRSEAAFPLRSGDRTIGVLDVQSRSESAFQPEDLETLAWITSWLSNAVQKTRMVEKLQQNLSEVEVAARRDTLRSWRDHLRLSRKHYAFQYQNAKVTTPTEPAGADRYGGIEIEETIIVPSQDPQKAESIIAVPIKLRDQPLGYLRMRVNAAKVPSETIQLVEDAVNRLAISLENARLLEELQNRAQRERMVGEIASKVYTANDIDTILRTAANEIGRSLGASDVVVQLNPK